MPFLHRDNRQLLILILLLVARLLTPAAARRGAAANLVVETVCPSRTINYITHSLPQQCLRTSRASTSSISTTDHQAPTAQPSTDRPSSSEKEKATTAVHPPTPLLPSQEDESDAESPLSRDKFLSFEEWKKQNLDKYGQSADEVGKPKKLESIQPRRPPINVLDSLGDEAEIDIDFASFSAEKPQVQVPGDKKRDIPRSAEVPGSKARSKDAGTTFKERFNYASFDCAATILKTNAKSSGSSAVLVENKDSYMLNECSVENKFIVLELCDDILIDTIVVANFEFFSSIFASFRLSVADRYPVKAEKWKVLGTFHSRNTREVQPFLVENPMIWAKYVRIEFLTHYGNEFYCPISLIRVHGITMLEDYRHEEEQNKGGEPDEEQQDPEPLVAVPESSVDAVTQRDIPQRTVMGPMTSTAQATISSPESSIEPSSGELVCETLPLTANVSIDLFALLQCDVERPHVSSDKASSQTTTLQEPSTAAKTSTPIPGEKNSSNDIKSPTKTESAIPEAAAKQTVSTPASDAVKFSSTPASVASESKTANSSSTVPSPPHPTVQESFFKSVQKRLQMLESNSTLSLQYIELQSRILRDAFSQVEQRQLSKTTKFIDYLNGTVLAELRDFRQQYDQLWQSTVLELEAQRERSQRDAVTMDVRISILADELTFQKRMAILQTILVLICIGLVLFPREAVNSYLEHPLVQNMLTRSATFKMRGSYLETPSMSPISTRPSSSYKMPSKSEPTVAKTLYDGSGLHHRRMLSTDSDLSAEHPSVTYLPPTPASYDYQSETDTQDDQDTPVSQPLPSELQRSASSPPDVRTSLDEPSTPTQGTMREVSSARLTLSPASSSASSTQSSSQESGEGSYPPSPVPPHV